MIYCHRQGDYPLRMSAKNSRIVHAVRSYNNYSGRGVTYRTACECYPSITWGWEHVRKPASITCQNCQRALGMSDKDPSDVRYLIYDSASGMYLKTGAKSKWVEEPYDATRWRNKDIPRETINFIMKHHRRGAKPTLKIKRAKLQLEFI